MQYMLRQRKTKVDFSFFLPEFCFDWLSFVYML